MRLSAFDPPPLSEWALILGDAIHNLRSALDVLVWAHVDEGTLSERQARDIAFPIWSEASKWDDNSARLLATVPAEIAQRIHGCQPSSVPRQIARATCCPYWRSWTIETSIGCR